MDKQELDRLLSNLELIGKALSDAKECTGTAMSNQLIKHGVPNQTINKIERANTGIVLAQKLLATHTLSLLAHIK